ncbi:hypothetical protein [Pseudoleptotrichia goodfellowii]|uniref:Uncharacterized protein n=1 Tax=Pseudoleptotrichia goodfellowii TaxID=157692 RepID=A0A510JBB0_9FUSO|nr:hypothetical protein [Pseudoleptotrichia goodfellowii]BBM35475.1 hypothetical protein JCM16774_0388 [Pseudoleptotrichia goodfellowii]
MEIGKIIKDELIGIRKKPEELYCKIKMIVEEYYPYSIEIQPTFNKCEKDEIRNIKSRREDITIKDTGVTIAYLFIKEEKDFFEILNIDSLLYLKEEFEIKYERPLLTVYESDSVVIETNKIEDIVDYCKKKSNPENKIGFILIYYKNYKILYDVNSNKYSCIELNLFDKNFSEIADKIDDLEKEVVYDKPIDM